MYGLVVKTSFGVWRLSFMFFATSGSGDIFVFAMVDCPSVTKSCLRSNLKTVQDILMELHRNINQH